MHGLAYKKVQLVLLLSIVIVAGVIILFPFNFQNNFINIVLTVTTFLFGIFVTFSINDRSARMEKIRANDADERSNLVTVYNLSKDFGKNFTKRIQKKIDEYLMATLDYPIWDFYKTEKQFNNLFNLVINTKLNKKSIQQEIIRRLDDMRLLRGETAEIINERLSRFEWVIITSLCLVVLTCLILINPGTLTSKILLGTLSIAVVFIVYFLYSLDSLSWKAESRIFEPYAQTFESIGLTRYYPDGLVISGIITKHKGKKYRIGIFPKPYPDFSDKKIKIVGDNGK